MNEALERALSDGKHKKVLRYLLGCLGGTPFIGGAFGATAAAWAESEQSKINVLILNSLKILDERTEEAADKLVVSNEPQQWVAAHIRFNPNDATFIDSSNVSSLTDNGHLDFTINFAAPLQDGFVLQYFGSSEVRLDGFIESARSVRVRFLEPCPDNVAFVFFNLNLT